MSPSIVRVGRRPQLRLPWPASRRRGRPSNCPARRPPTAPAPATRMHSQHWPQLLRPLLALDDFGVETLTAVTTPATSRTTTSATCMTTRRRVRRTRSSTRKYAPTEPGAVEARSRNVSCTRSARAASSSTAARRSVAGSRTSAARIRFMASSAARDCRRAEPNESVTSMPASLREATERSASTKGNRCIGASCCHAAHVTSCIARSSTSMSASVSTGSAGSGRLEHGRRGRTPTSTEATAHNRHERLDGERLGCAGGLDLAPAPPKLRKGDGDQVIGSQRPAGLPSVRNARRDSGSAKLPTNSR